MQREYIIRHTGRKILWLIVFFVVLYSVSYILYSSASVVFAKSKADIKFPVQELGGCKSEQECKTYCGNPKNMSACLNFAEQYNLMPKEEISRAKKFAAVGAKGPGNCSSKESCENYCNDIKNINECLAFAEKSGVMDKKELDEARKVKAALDKGAKLPGGCRNKEECETYCDDPNQPNRMKECIAFAKAAGFMEKEELREAEKVLSAMEKGHKPPSCRGKKECDKYCSAPENIESCLIFAEAADLIPKDELKEAKKYMAAVKKGVKPLPCNGKDECDEYCSNPENIESCIIFAEAAGFMEGEELEEAKMMLKALKGGAKMLPCRSKASCDEYCNEPAHFEECVTFAEAAGFMSSEEASMARKTGGKGPGGCRGEKECDDYCNNSDNQEECFKFGLEYGLIPEEDLEDMREGVEQMQDTLENADEEVMACLENSLGAATIAKIKDGTVMPSEKIGNAMQQCFESIMGGENRGDFDNEESFDEEFSNDEEFNDEFENFEDEEFFDDELEEQGGSLLQKGKNLLKRLKRAVL